uniref:cell division topological specificity factor MinE n=1 Tax=Agathobacter sp. TaxID=2021311 RepID=UPI00405769F0
MIFHKRRNHSSLIAKERLKLMRETENIEYSACDISQLKKDISALISRHFDLSPDMFEIKVTLKQDKKRV